MRTIMFLAMAAMSAAPLVAQQCPNDRSPYPSIGVERYQCRGGSCSVNRMQDTYRHMFTTEPIVIRTGSQASRGDDVIEGDVIVSVEGALITSREGGLTLGSLPIGEPANVQVRRGDRLMTLEVVPEGSCELPGLLVSSELPVLLANSAQRSLLVSQQLTAARLMTSQAPE